MMTREEAIKVLNNFPIDFRNSGGFEAMEALKIAILALRPFSRELVDKVWKGEWIIGEPDVLGVPIHCSRCGWGSDHADQRAWMEYKGHIFCGHCSAPMTDEAVEMVMERMEALYERNDD